MIRSRCVICSTASTTTPARCGRSSSRPATLLINLHRKPNDHPCGWSSRKVGQNQLSSVLDKRAGGACDQTSRRCTPRSGLCSVQHANALRSPSPPTPRPSRPRCELGCCAPRRRPGTRMAWPSLSLAARHRRATRAPSALNSIDGADQCSWRSLPLVASRRPYQPVRRASSVAGRRHSQPHRRRHSMSSIVTTCVTSARHPERCAYE
jgi:hypothetical protein